MLQFIDDLGVMVRGMAPARGATTCHAHLTRNVVGAPRGCMPSLPLTLARYYNFLVGLARVRESAG